MNIPSEARAISQTIIEWCFRDEQGSDDENLPTHLVENLLIRQKQELIDKACNWLDANAKFEKVDGKWKFNIEEFRKTMED